MSEFQVKVVRLGPVEKHPNADTLGLVKVFGYPVIVKLGELQENDLAVYIQIDSVVPSDDPRWAFLKGRHRIRAARLRGIFSMGLLVKADPGWVEGQDVQEALRITKYEPPEPLMTGGESERCPFDFPKFTDIDAWRRYPDVLKDGEEVVLTEKTHGTSGRWAWAENRLWCGSHREIKKESMTSVYWKVAAQYGLAERLRDYPGIAFYGEIYGWVQDLRYGHTPGKVSLVLFDILDLANRHWLDYDDFEKLSKKLAIPTVPVLYRGPWSKDVLKHAEGQTLLGGDHVREGAVIRPVKERFDERIQRVILKYHSEGYLLRKGG